MKLLNSYNKQIYWRRRMLERLKEIWKNEREYLDDVMAIFKRALITLAFITFLFTTLSLTAILIFKL